MLQTGLTQPSDSPWSAPVVLVRKKDGSTRFCVDYRRLNSVTRKDSYPIPRIDDALDALSGAKYFSTLDLRSGYHKVEMDKTSRQYTVFVTSSDLYEFNVLHFGLCNAPSTFQRLMNQVLQGLDGNICLICLDDIIIFSATIEQHLFRLRCVLHRLRASNLTLNPDKCFFGQSSVLFLGHIVSQDGIQPNPEKTQAVREFPRPRNVKDVRAFIGLASSYYRRSVKNFASIARPLTCITRKNIPFKWDKSCHPQTDGLVERFNGNLAETLSMFVSSNQKDWEEHLPQVLFAYRVSLNANAGESPFYLIYAREPRLPMDISLLPPVNLSSSIAEHIARILTTLEEARKLIASNTQLAQLKMKARYDLSAHPIPYTVGQRVWVYTTKRRKGLSTKLLHNYNGLHRIVEKLLPVHFKLRTQFSVSVPVHANRLKPYFDSKDRPIEAPTEHPSQQDEPHLRDDDIPSESFATVPLDPIRRILRPQRPTM